MFVKFCDACGKQLNRYEAVNNVHYDIRSKVKMTNKDGETCGVGLASLDFCPECYAKIEASINKIMKELPNTFDTVVSRDRFIDN